MSISANQKDIAMFIKYVLDDNVDSLFDIFSNNQIYDIAMIAKQLNLISNISANRTLSGFVQISFNGEPIVTPEGLSFMSRNL